MSNKRIEPPGGKFEVGDVVWVWGFEAFLEDKEDEWGDWFIRGVADGREYRAPLCDLEFISRPSLAANAQQQAPCAACADAFGGTPGSQAKHTCLYGVQPNKILPSMQADPKVITVKPEPQNKAIACVCQELIKGHDADCLYILTKETV